MNTDTKKLVIYSIFLTAIPVSVLLSSKITTIYGLTFTVGAFAYVLTFPCTDAIGEVFGKTEAKRLVALGLIGYVATFLLTWLAVSLPPAEFWAVNQQSYETTLALVPRIALAAVVTYFVAQLHDVWAFSFWKRATQDRHLWLRNNLSTMSSQAIDTVIFVVVAFFGTVPNSILLSMILGQYLVKIGIAAADTPLVYLAVAWLKSK